MIKTHMRRFIVLMLALTASICSYAQDEIIKPSDGGLSVFDDNAIENIRIVTSDAESLLIEVKCKIEEDKSYVFSGDLLDARKKKLKGFTCKPQELSKGSETVDLSFVVSKKNTQSKTQLKSAYIIVRMAEKEDDSLLGDLEDLMGGSDDNPLGDMFSKKFTFKYEKDWRLKGNKNMVVKIPLTPVGSAKSLK